MLTENKLFFAAKKFNFMKILVARYTGIYGPLQDYDINKASLIPAICFKAIGKKKNINLLTNGNEMRSYCFIDDAINCTMLMCEKNELNYDIYNVCSNHIETIKSIAKNVDYQFCSNDKAVNKLGWNCDTELMTGLSYTFRDIEKRVNYKK
jgi:nucleoside-diphosphate-sugar epimerase